jgi:multicomponent Na+:H+ antiporter subunit G
MAEVLVGVTVIAGAILMMLAGIGVLRFPDIYTRMHAATKASTLGIGLIAIAGSIAIDDGAAKILLAAGFIFVTTPSGAHFLGRAAYRAKGVDLKIDGQDDLERLMRGDSER